MFRLLEFLFIAHLGIYVLLFSVSISCYLFVQGQLSFQMNTKKSFSNILLFEHGEHILCTLSKKVHTNGSKFGGQNIIIGQSFQRREVKRQWKSWQHLVLSLQGAWKPFQIIFPAFRARALIWGIIIPPNICSSQNTSKGLTQRTKVWKWSRLYL